MSCQHISQKKRRREAEEIVDDEIAHQRKRVCAEIESEADDLPLADARRRSRPSTCKRPSRHGEVSQSVDKACTAVERSISADFDIHSDARSNAASNTESNDDDDDDDDAPGKATHRKRGCYSLHLREVPPRSDAVTGALPGHRCRSSPPNLETVRTRTWTSREWSCPEEMELDAEDWFSWPCLSFALGDLSSSPSSGCDGWS